MPYDFPHIQHHQFKTVHRFKYICIWMLFGEALIIEKKEMLQKLSIEKWWKKWWHNCAMEYYTAIFGSKRKKIVVCVTNAEKQDKEIYRTTGNVMI